MEEGGGKDRAVSLGQVELVVHVGADNGIGGAGPACLLATRNQHNRRSNIHADVEAEVDMGMVGEVVVDQPIVEVEDTVHDIDLVVQRLVVDKHFCSHLVVHPVVIGVNAEGSRDNLDVRKQALPDPPSEPCSP